MSKLKTTDAAVRLLVSQFMPQDMRYTAAQPIISGNGRFKKRIPRRVGHTEDSLFSLEMWGKPDKVHKVVFLSLADSPPIVLSQALIAIKGTLAAVLPDYDGWDSLIAEIGAGNDVTVGDVRATFQQLDPNVKVLFVVVG